MVAAWETRGDLLTCAALSGAGVPHGVTLRGLGGMADAGARARALEAAGLGGRPLFLGRQVHGTAVSEAPQASMDPAPECDGWVTRARAVALGVTIADCLPIFLWDRGLSALGVFHAGWRGIAAGMPREAVRQLERLGVEPPGMGAAIGPHAGVCCYRVGPELEGRFRPQSFSREDGVLRLDLAAEARAQLEEAGLEPGSIEVSEDCTVCGPDRFFSFRRERVATRMMAFAGLP